MLRVGLLTSWRVPCGIYQYSARLADALNDVGVQPVILAGRADEHRSVPEESDHEVHDVAQIGLWRDDQTYSLDLDKIQDLDLDVIHVQYQSMLFTQPDLERLATEHPGRMVITFHDKCQRPDFPYPIFTVKFSHRWDVGPFDVRVIPFGIEDRPPIVRTFGLGRTQSDLIQEVCDRRGWIFEDGSTHETIHGGGQHWRTHEELIQWLRGADAIVLWYADVDQAGSSQAARTAMASRRPVYTNDTTWFKDLPSGAWDLNHSPLYSKVSDLDTLEFRLMCQFDRPYVAENSWTLVATEHVNTYESPPVAAE